MTFARDWDLKQRIHNFLVGKSVIRPGAVRIHVTDGFVELEGHVHSYYEKQLIIHATQHVAGVVGISDQIEVVEAESHEPVAMSS